MGNICRGSPTHAPNTNSIAIHKEGESEDSDFVQIKHSAIPLTVMCQFGHPQYCDDRSCGGCLTRDWRCVQCKSWSDREWTYDRVFCDVCYAAGTIAGLTQWQLKPAPVCAACRKCVNAERTLCALCALQCERAVVVFCFHCVQTFDFPMDLCSVVRSYTL